MPSISRSRPMPLSASTAMAVCAPACASMPGVCRRRRPRGLWPGRGACGRVQRDSYDGGLIDDPCTDRGGASRSPRRLPSARSAKKNRPALGGCDGSELGGLVAFSGQRLGERIIHPHCTPRRCNCPRTRSRVLSFLFFSFFRFGGLFHSKDGLVMCVDMSVDMCVEK